MKQIDGLVTKDEIYRLISGFRTRFKISEEAAHEMAKRVAEMPTVEAELVKHARWEHHAGMNSKCTYCGNYFPVAEFEKRPFDVNYCIWCGARMDGDSE